MSDDRGVVYLCIGRKHLALLAVSVRSLLKHWPGPVAFFADKEALPFCDKILDVAGHGRLLPIEPQHRAYAVKPAIPALSPFSETIQVDADTIWAGSPVGLFDMLTPQLFIVTSFGGWHSQGPRMQGRIEGWWDKDRERVQAATAKPWPAINTGVVAYGSESPVAREAWLAETLRYSRVFMADETAAQLILPDYAERPDLMRVVGDSWNCSPRFGAEKDRAVVWHFHGHNKLGRLEEYRRLWEPEWQAAWKEDWAGIRSWARQGAKGWIEEYIQRTEGDPCGT